MIVDSGELTDGRRVALAARERAVGQSQGSSFDRLPPEAGRQDERGARRR